MYNFSVIKPFVVAPNPRQNSTLADAKKVLAYFKRLGVYDFEGVFLNPTVNGLVQADLIPVGEVEGLTDSDPANFVVKRKGLVDGFNVAAIIVRLTKSWPIDVGTRMQMAEFGVEFGPMPEHPEELVLEFRNWLAEIYAGS